MHVSKPKPIDPDKRAAKAERRKRRKAHEAAGLAMTPRAPRPTAQMDHATNPRAARAAREGERAMHRERGPMSTCISARGEFGSHDLDDEHTCRDCGVLDEDALRAELRELRAVPTARQNGKTAIPTLDTLRGQRPPLDGLTLARTDFNDTYDTDRTVVADLAEANLITSQVAGSDLHKVVLDVDLPCGLIASSTPGHFHLFIDKAMTWPEYAALLEALTAAGIVEVGYLAAAQRRGHTAVRLPWVRKPAA